MTKHSVNRRKSFEVRVQQRENVEKTTKFPVFPLIIGCKYHSKICSLFSFHNKCFDAVTLFYRSQNIITTFFIFTYYVTWITISAVRFPPFHKIDTYFLCTSGSIVTHYTYCWMCDSSETENFMISSHFPPAKSDFERNPSIDRVFCHTMIIVSN